MEKFTRSPKTRTGAEGKPAFAGDPKAHFQANYFKTRENVLPLKVMIAGQDNHRSVDSAVVRIHDMLHTLSTTNQV